MFTKQISILAISLLALSSVGFGQPSHHRRHVHNKRSPAVTITVTHRVYRPGATPAPKPAAQAPAPATAPKAAAPAPAPAAIAPANNGGGSSVSIPKKGGIVYSPYADNKGCKPPQQQASEAGKLSNYGLVRLYGTDCAQIESVLPVVAKAGNKMFLGVYKVENLNQELDALIKGVKGNWGAVHTVSIGNEHVNGGKQSPQNMVNFVNQARQRLRGAGYKGPVVIVDTFNKVLEHPQLCKASDYTAVNLHPFFDPHTSPDQAGSFMDTQVARVKKVCDNKPLLVTETGWPSKGNANGKAQPGGAQQTTAISKILGSKQGKDVILLSAFNELWKDDFPGSFNAEKWWGLLNL